MQGSNSRQVVLIIPVYPNMELAAAQTGYTLAEIMDFDEDHIDEIQIALIETCINAFEHSKSPDGQISIQFIMADDKLVLKVTDHGVGFKTDEAKEKGKDGVKARGMRKRGWGLEIIKNMMDHVEIESTDKGTTVTMVKKRQPAAHPAHGQ